MITVNETYVDMLMRLRDAIKTKWVRELSEKILFFAQHSSSHKAALIQKLLADFWRYIFPRAVCSLDHTPSGYYLYQKLHKDIGGHCFHSSEAVQNFICDYFQKMDATFRHLGISKLVQRYNKCSDVLGDHVEKYVPPRM